jgi:two-component system, NarL family, invasion response regulator UvrY
MIKIIIADDHPIVRYGLKQLISDESDMKVTGEAENAACLFELIKKNNYDLLILDLSLPDINGLEVLSKLKHSKADIAVLVLSALPEEQYALRCLKAGAAGYLNKIAASSQLINAIRKIISGGNYLSPAISDQILSDLKKDKKKVLHENLSQREFEIMCLLGIGKSVKEIADNLILSIPTVYTYRSRIYQKMNMKTDTEIVQYCIIESLV